MNKRTLQSLILGIAIGMAIGLGVYTFVYAKGASYLTNNPASCANCHVMNEQYEGWLKSSHRAVASSASLSPVPLRSGSQPARPRAARARMTPAMSARVRFISSKSGGMKRMAGASGGPIRIIHSCRPSLR